MTNHNEAMTSTRSSRAHQPLAVSVDRAAAMLGVSPSKLWDMLRSAELPRVRLGGRTVVRVSDLEAYLNRCVTSGGETHGTS